MPFTYETIDPEDGRDPWIRIADAEDNAICTCYDPANAEMIVNALNNDPAAGGSRGAVLAYG